MKQIRESDHFKRKKKHNQNTPTLKKITKIIKTKQSKTKQTNNQVTKPTNTNMFLQLHNIGGVMVSMQRLCNWSPLSIQHLGERVKTGWL